MTIAAAHALSPALLVHWKKISAALRLRTEADHRRVTEMIDVLLDMVGDDRRHPLYDLLDTLGTLVHAFEEEHFPMPEGSPKDVLRSLMDEHELTQQDVPEIGSQGVVSEVLRGKRTLNIRQVAALAERFDVSPAVFIPEYRT
jgi:HTH-type transcriptional regulator/antitoxin HigA